MGSLMLVLKLRITRWGQLEEDFCSWQTEKKPVPSSGNEKKTESVFDTSKIAETLDMVKTYDNELQIARMIQKIYTGNKSMKGISVNFHLLHKTSWKEDYQTHSTHDKRRSEQRRGGEDHLDWYQDGDPTRANKGISSNRVDWGSVWERSFKQLEGRMWTLFLASQICLTCMAANIDKYS